MLAQDESPRALRAGRRRPAGTRSSGSRATCSASAARPATRSAPRLARHRAARRCLVAGQATTPPGARRAARLPGRDAGGHAGPAGRQPPRTTPRCTTSACACCTKTGWARRWPRCCRAATARWRPGAAAGAAGCASRSGCRRSGWQLGSAPGGLVPHNERWAHEVAVPEFEIDAQPVSWGAFRRVRRGRRLRPPRALERGRLGLAAGAAAGVRRAMSSSCAAACWCSAAAGLQRAPAAAAGDARQPLRGRGLVPLGRPPPAHRARVGAGGAAPPAAAASSGAMSSSGWPAAPAPGPGPAQPSPGSAGRDAAGRHRRVCCAAPRSPRAPRQRHPKARRFAPPGARHDVLRLSQLRAVAQARPAP